MEFRDPSRILLIFIFKDRPPEKLQVAIEKNSEGFYREPPCVKLKLTLPSW